MRADQLLVERGLAVSRSQAVRLIAGGLRWRDAGTQDAWQRVARNRDDLPATAELELDDAGEARYLSRGGLKLEGALRVAAIDPSGWLCLDVGQSTGGFTDCLLQHGAAQVVGIDVGHGQLHARIREDERVLALEQVNARALTAGQLIEAAVEAGWDADDERWDGSAMPAFDLIVGDLSFISLTLVLPALVPLLSPQGRLLMLVKPQFELQPGQVGKGGIVRDASMYPVVEARLREACVALGLRVVQWFDSPIAGGDGNREFFIHAEPAEGAGGEPGAGHAPTPEL